MDNWKLLRYCLLAAVLLAGLTAGCKQSSDTAPVDREALKRELEELNKQRREDEKSEKAKK